MEKIEGIDLGKLVEDVSQDVLEERRKQAANIIKQKLQRIEQLAGDIKIAERQLKDKKEKLQKAQEKIDKIKAGDWSILVEDQKKEEKEA